MSVAGITQVDNIMERDDGVYEGKWEVQGEEGILPASENKRDQALDTEERLSMERGLAAFKEAHPTTPPPPPPPPPPPRPSASSTASCTRCPGDGWLATQCTGCGKQKVSIPQSQAPTPTASNEIDMSDAGHADDEEL